MRGAGSTPISFNTVNGKYCYNTPNEVLKGLIRGLGEFQYRKR